MLNASPQLWWWQMSKKFEDWLERNKANSLINVEFEKRRFETNGSHAKAVLTALTAITLGLVVKLAIE